MRSWRLGGAIESWRVRTRASMWRTVDCRKTVLSRQRDQLVNVITVNRTCYGSQNERWYYLPKPLQRLCSRLGHPTWSSLEKAAVIYLKYIISSRDIICPLPTHHLILLLSHSHMMQVPSLKGPVQFSPNFESVRDPDEEVRHHSVRNSSLIRSFYCIQRNKGSATRYPNQPHAFVV